VALAGALALSACQAGHAEETVPGPRYATGAYCEGSITTSHPPRPTKLVVIIGENRSTDEVKYSPEAPFQQILTDQCGFLANMHNETHGSESNYLALVSGGYPRWGLCDYPPADSTPGCPYGPSGMISGPNVFQQLEDKYGAGGWRTYAQSMGYTDDVGQYRPKNCQPFDGVPYIDANGKKQMTYVVRHNPAVYFTGISCSTYDVPMGDLDAQSGPFFSAANSGTLPRLSLVIPNDVANSHDSTLRDYDTFLRQTISFLRGTPDYRAGDLAVIVTYDEGDVDRGTRAEVGADCTLTDQDVHEISCQISSWVVGRYVPHLRDTGFETHYSMLRTIEEWAGLPLIGEAAAPSTKPLDARLLLTRS
jgi:acid phosphatase